MLLHSCHHTQVWHVFSNSLWDHCKCLQSVVKRQHSAFWKSDELWFLDYFTSYLPTAGSGLHPLDSFFSNARSKKCRCLTACLLGKKQDVLCLQNFPSCGRFLTGPHCSPRSHAEGTLPQASRAFDSTRWLCKFRSHRNVLCLLPDASLF